MKNFKTYVIHVKGSDQRFQIISNEIAAKKIDAEYILNGNKENINDNILDRFFKGEMREVKNATSCALKHILAYQQLQQSGNAFALILEDDIELYDNFIPTLEKSIDEIVKRKLKNVLVCFEESGLRYVKKSERQSDIILYQQATGRMAGAYLIDLGAANTMLHYIQEHKIGEPIDFFHNTCSSKKIISIYWSHPSTACQRSINGKINSLIDNKKTGIVKQLGFNIERIYKKILYRLR